jgi:hypothetical protein
LNGEPLAVVVLKGTGKKGTGKEGMEEKTPGGKKVVKNALCFIFGILKNINLSN